MFLSSSGRKRDLAKECTAITAMRKRFVYTRLVSDDIQKESSRQRETSKDSGKETRDKGTNNPREIGRKDEVYLDSNPHHCLLR